MTPLPYGSGATETDIREWFTDGEWPVAVYGLGKMGVPLAAVFAGVTGSVEGVDIDPNAVARLNRGECPIDGEPGLESLVADLVGAGKFAATVEGASAAAESAIHVVIVPTTIRAGNRPDVSALESVAGTIGQGLSPGDLILVESTVPVGTSRGLVRRLAAETSGLSVDEFGVAYCPERTSSGRALEDIRGAYPKIVGGVDDESTRLAKTIYEEITSNDVIPVADAETAECVKLFEGVYRDVNIALANELATFTRELDVDVRAVIEAANTQPFCDIHSPGPGVGGHCIPYYPWFLTDGLSSPARLIATARYVNDRMPIYTAERCLELLESRGLQPTEATALLLGVAYRPDVAEAQKSPAVDIAAALAGRGMSVFAVDPVLPSMPEMEATSLPVDAVDAVDPDLVIVVTPHTAFQSIDWSAFDDALIVDCRDGLDGQVDRSERWVLGSN